MAYAESNGHVTDDFMWPRKVKSRKWLDIETPFQRTTNGK